MTDLAKGRILVTGGAGFIGSALTWELNRRGLKNILVADILGQDEKWRNLAPLQFADYVEAGKLLEGIDGGSHLYSDVTSIFHLGACSSTTMAPSSSVRGPSCSAMRPHSRGSGPTAIVCPSRSRCGSAPARRSSRSHGAASRANASRWTRRP